MHTLGFQSNLQKVSYMSGIVYNHRPKWYNRQYPTWTCVMNFLPRKKKRISSFSMLIHSISALSLAFSNFILPILKIIAHYKVGHHPWDMGFRLYCHSGMSIIPYMNSWSIVLGGTWIFSKLIMPLSRLFGYSHTLNSEYLKLKPMVRFITNLFPLIPSFRWKWAFNQHKGIVNIAKLHTHTPYALVITNTSVWLDSYKVMCWCFSDIAQLLFKDESKISEIINTNRWIVAC